MIVFRNEFGRYIIWSHDINGKDTNKNIIFTKTTLVRLKTSKIETQNKCKQSFKTFNFNGYSVN